MAELLGDAAWQGGASTITNILIARP